MDTIYGDDGGDDTETFSGLRPSVTFNTDGFSVSAAYEHIENEGGFKDATKDGFGITTSINVGDGTLNIWGASGAVEDSLQFVTTQDENGEDFTTTELFEYDVLSVGANITLGSFGAGLILSEQDVDNSDDDPETTTAYVAYTLPLLGIEGASATIAASHSQVDGLSSTYDDSLTSFRLRFNYTFN